MGIRLRLVGLSVCVCLAACGGRIHIDNPDPFAEDDPRALSEKTKKKRAVGNEPGDTITGHKAQTGTIDRASLNDVLERGLGAFLSGVEVQAYFDNHAFAGWEVVRFWPKHSAYTKVDLRPGDVVLAINNHRLEKPSQVQRLWKKLRTADTLVVSGKRLGEAFQLRFEIRGSHKPAMP